MHTSSLGKPTLIYFFIQTQISIPNDTDSVAFGLENFLTSVSLQENGYYAYVAGNINIDRSICRAIIENLYTCDNIPKSAIWISPQNARQYSLFQKGHGSSNSVSVLQSIVSNGWADLPTLLDGAFNCTAQVSLSPLSSSVTIPQGKSKIWSHHDVCETSF